MGMRQLENERMRLEKSKIIGGFWVKEEHIFTPEKVALGFNWRLLDSDVHLSQLDALSMCCD